MYPKPTSYCRMLFGFAKGIGREACLSYWDAAQTNAEVKHAINTRITHESVFNYFKTKLAKVGVTKLSVFKAILHSAQNMECAQRKRELAAKRLRL